ncbi:lyase family protein [Streptomyces sp. UNOC14_S4]|uniref:lyase family protein n=1 Tax=Streptomyces sp. UNOC14_S4 TaxID=2872340 RepID=UPI001E43DCE2|nr:lyase family protein [Streptomyces sp. UNOC14_S4]MCC3771042.1 aspartate ammonia-lyase [Streptomyces sp. UNOC14_S4]
MREDEDELGTVNLPDDVYYGVNTVRAQGNFDVSGAVLGDFPAYLTALAHIKKAAALANADIGVLRPQVAEAVCQAADEVAAGRFGRRQFPVDMMSGGGGTSPNMNVNEVLANRANEILCGHKGYDLVHPNNHVNACQSTTDVIATAITLALHRDLGALIGAVGVLENALEEKIEEYRGAVKLARTCLQDAVPITFDQEFGAYLAVVRRSIARLRAAAANSLDVPMGATIVGTGLGVGASYLEHIYPRLAEVTGLPVRKHPNFFDCIQNGDIFQEISTVLKGLATNLAKMAHDISLLASGNRAGLMELSLPAVQAGSSFVPGKVNPVLPEMITQIAYQISGNDTVITMAVQGADLDYNAWTAVIAKNLFESCRLLQHGVPLFADKCIRGLRMDTQRCRGYAELSLALSSMVGVVFGHDDGARVAYHAKEHGTSIRESAVLLGVMDEETADVLLDPVTLTDAALSSTVLDRLVERRRAQTRALISGLPVEVRRGLLTVAVAMAQADGVIAPEEVSALDVVADVLQVPLDHDLTLPVPLPTGLAALDLQARELIYSCSLWIAFADETVVAEESNLLGRLRVELDLSEDTATGLRAKVAQVRGTRHGYLHQFDKLPWWEEFEGLVATLAADSAS